MKKFRFLVLVAVLVTAGCSDPKSATRALDAAGYSEIKLGGASLFACGQDDFYSTKFTAKNPAGKNVNGVVCSGLFMKNATIRH